MAKKIVHHPEGHSYYIDTVTGETAPVKQGPPPAKKATKKPATKKAARKK